VTTGKRLPGTNVSVTKRNQERQAANKASAKPRELPSVASADNKKTVLERKRKEQ